jgi:23S rRNA-/tRNA-specific pseudouridylate synthase
MMGYATRTAPTKPARSMTAASSGRALRIAEAGDGWLVAEKPAGISVHNDPGTDLRALLADRVAKDPVLRRRVDFDPAWGFHAVGRLDKEADGLILCAWRPEVFAALSAQYAGRETGKTYLVLVHGCLGDGRDGLSWNWPLSAGAAGRRDPAGRPPRVDCRTEVEILEQGRDVTLIRCRPHTGRQHQIRRHAALSGHPVAGDRRYGPPRAAEDLERRFGFARIGLHARSLTFTPPGAGRPITVESAAVPPIFETLLESGAEV